MKEFKSIFHSGYRLTNPFHITSATSDLMMSTIQNAKKKSISFKTYGNGSGNASSQTLNAKKMTDMYMNLAKNNGELSIYDLETIGNLKEGASQVEKDLATITEFSITRKKMSMQNGVIHGETLESINGVFGFNDKQSNRARNLMQSFKDGTIQYESLEQQSGVKSIMDRLARAGSAYREAHKLGEGIQFTEVNGLKVPIMPKLKGGPFGNGTYDKLNMADVEAGIEFYSLLGKNGYSLDSDKGKAVYKTLTSKLEKASKGINTAVAGHNILNYDNPYIENMNSKYGIKSSFGNNFIDSYEVIKGSGVDPTNLYEDGKMVKKGVLRQENLIGIDATGAHSADFDTENWYRVFQNEINGKTRFDIIKESLDKKLQSESIISPNKTDKFKVTSSLLMRDVEGNYVKDDSGIKSLDHIVTIGNDGKPKRMEYKKGALNANSYYNFTSLKEIPVKELDEEMRKHIPKGIEKVYAASFNKIGASINEQSIIIRDSIEKIQEIFDVNLKNANDINGHMINRENKNVASEKIRGVLGRNTYNGVYSFESQEKLYDTFLNAKSTFKEHNQNFKKKDINRIIAEGKYVFQDGTEVSAKELLKGVYNGKGDINEGRLTAFRDGFDWLEEVAPVHSEMIKEIKKSLPGDSLEIKSRRADVFNSTRRDIVEKIEDNFNMTLQTKDSASMNAKKALSIEVIIDGEPKYIDTTNENTIKGSINRIVKADGYHNSNANTLASVEQNKINNIIDQLKDKGVITSSKAEKMKNISQKTYSLDSVAKNVRESVVKLQTGLTPTQLEDPVSASKKVEEEIKELKKHRKEIVQTRNKINKFKPDGSYVGADSEKVIDKDLEKLNKEIAKLKTDKDKLDKAMKGEKLPKEDYNTILKEVKDLKDKRNAVKKSSGSIKELKAQRNNISKGIAGLKEEKAKLKNWIDEHKKINLETKGAVASELFLDKRNQIKAINEKLNTEYKAIEGINSNIKSIAGFNSEINSKQGSLDKIQEYHKTKKKIIKKEDELAERLRKRNKTSYYSNLGKTIGVNEDLDEITNAILKNYTVRGQLRGVENLGGVNMDLLNYSSKPMFKSNVDGERVGYRKMVKSTFNVGELVEKHIANSAPRYGTLINSVNNQNNALDTLKTYFKNDLNYNDNEISTILDKLTSSDGRYGILNAKDINGNSDLAFSLVKSFDKTKDLEEHFLVFGRQGSLQSIESSVRNGQFGNNMVSLRLPKIVEKSGARYAKLGAGVKSMTTNVGMYINKANGNKAVFKTSNIISETFDTINSSWIKENIYDFIDNKEGDRLSKRVNNKNNKKFGKLSGLTGYSNVLQEDGTFKRLLTPNIGDMSKTGLVDASALINLAPDLYDFDEGFRKQMDEDFEKGMRSKTAKEYFQEWKSDMTHKGSDKYGKLKTIDEVDAIVKEAYISNFLGNNGIAKRLSKNEKIMGKYSSKDFNLKALLEDYATNGSYQGINEKVVSDFKFTTVSARKLAGLGDLQAGVRPLLTQSGQFSYTDITDLSKSKKDMLKKAGITLGRTFESLDAERLISNVDGKKDLLEGFTINMKMIGDKKINRIVEGFKLDNDVVNHLENILTNKYNHKINHDEIKAVANSILKSGYFQNGLSTHLQRTVASPIFSEILKTPTHINYDISNFSEVAKQVGQSIRVGDVIGFDDKGKEIIYKNNRNGKIVGLSNGKFIIEENTPTISEIKGNFGKSEKGIIGIVNNKNEREMLVKQSMWEHMFGDVSALGHFELTKHQSSNFYYDKLNLIGRTVLESGDENKINEFLGQLDKISDKDNGKVSKLLTKFKGTEHEYSVFARPNAESTETNLFKGIESILGYYDNKAEKDTSGFYKSIKDKYDANVKDGVYSVDFSTVQMNRTHGSRVDNAVMSQSGSSPKLSEREMFYFGNKVGFAKESSNLYRTVNDTGNVEYVGQTIMDHHFNKALHTKEVQDVAKTISNINSAVNLQNGEIKQGTRAYKKLKIFEKDLSDIVLPSGGIDAEKLQETLFKEAEGYNVVKVNLGKDNLSIVDMANPNSRTNHIYLPVTANNYINTNGITEFVPTEIQKAEADIIDSLQKINVGNGKNPIKLRSNADRATRRLYEQYVKAVVDKEGLLKDNMLKFTIDYSSTNLVGGAVNPTFYMNGSENYKDVYSNIASKHKINGKEVDIYKDAGYLGEQALKDMGGNSLFEDLGYQLVNETDFDTNDSFKKHLKGKGIIKDDLSLVDGPSQKAYESIGKEYAKTVGIQGHATRYPVISGNSSTPISYFLDETTNSNSAKYTASTLMKVNGDLDGDKMNNTLLLNRGKDGRVRIFDKDTDVRKAHERLSTAEAIDNTVHWNEEALKEYEKVEKDSNIRNIENFQALTEEKSHTKNGNFLSDEAIAREGKARLGKSAIGPASNRNYEINRVVSMLDSQNKLDLGTIKSIQDFTQRTEQNPISSKFNDTSAVRGTAKYSKGISMMIDGNEEEGLKVFMDSMMELGFLEDNNGKQVTDRGINFNFLRQGDYKDELGKLKDSYSNQTMKDLHSIGALVNTIKDNRGEIKNTYDDYKFKTSIYTESIADGRLSNIVSELFNGEDINGDPNNLINLESKMIRESNNIAYSKRNAPIADQIKSNNFYYDSDGSVFRPHNRVQSKGNEIIYQLENLKNGDILSFKGAGEEFVNDTNNAIHKHLTEHYGLSSINTEGMNKAELTAITDDSFTNSYKGIVAKHRDSVANDFENKIQYDNILSEINERIIREGRRAKEFKEENLKHHAKSLYRQMDNISSKSLEVEPLSSQELDDNYKRFSSREVGEGNMYRNSINRNYTSTHANSSLLDESFSDYRAYSTDNFNREYKSVVNKTLNEGLEIGAIDNKNNSLEIAKRLEKKELNDVIEYGKNDMTGNFAKHFKEYQKDIDNYRSFAGWSNSFKGAVASTNLNEMGGYKDAIDHLNNLGSGRVSYGDYTGYSFSELSRTQRQDTVDAMNGFYSQLKGTNGSEEMQKFLIEGRSALEHYNQYVDHVGSIGANSEIVTNKVREINTTRVANNYNKDMQTLLDTDRIKEQMSAINDTIINEGAEKTKTNDLVRKKLTEEGESEVAKAFSLSPKSALLVGGGIMATTAILGASSGIAGKLNPNTTPATVHNSNEQAESKKLTPISAMPPKNIYMQKTGESYSVHAKSPYGTVNDTQIARALSVAHADKTGRVNIHMQKSRDSNDNWFSDAMANSLN